MYKTFFTGELGGAFHFGTGFASDFDSPAAQVDIRISCVFLERGTYFWHHAFLFCRRFHRFLDALGGMLSGVDRQPADCQSVTLSFFCFCGLHSQARTFVYLRIFQGLLTCLHFHGNNDGLWQRRMAGPAVSDVQRYLSGCFAVFVLAAAYYRTTAVFYAA